MKIRIATRKSPLALYQAHYIRNLLITHWPSLQIELIPITTIGDRFLETKLQAIGGKGLFVKELEHALQNNLADIAVHSMKDVPSVTPEPLTLHTICKRSQPFDAFVSQHYSKLHELPKGACIGTSSLRRQAQLLNIRPDLHIKTLRGNVGTRLEKLKNNEYDAIILAEAGLTRLELLKEMKQRLAPPDMIPAAGQGALGIECRKEDIALQALLEPLHDPIDALCVQTERNINQQLGGGCHSSIGIYCYVQNHLLHVIARITHPTGIKKIDYEAAQPIEHAQTLVHDCVIFFLSQKGEQLLYESP